jgi:hypothetical protein
VRAVLAHLLWGFLAMEAWADCGEVSLEELAAEAVAAVVDDELERAESLVEAGLQEARCTTLPVDPHTYATLWQVQAAVHFFRDDIALEGALGQAVAVSMDWFEPRLGSSLQALWEAPHYRHAQPSTVRIAPMTASASLWVNGEGQLGDSAQVLPGLHLVQVVADGSVVFFRMVDLRGGEQAILDAGFQQPRLSPSLLGRVALGGGALAVASWGGAMALDRSSLQATSLEAHDAQYAASRALAGTALGTAAVSLALWGVDRWRH